MLLTLFDSPVYYIVLALSDGIIRVYLNERAIITLYITWMITRQDDFVIDYVPIYYNT